jgi:hypothetical protein
MGLKFKLNFIIHVASEIGIRSLLTQYEGKSHSLLTQSKGNLLRADYVHVLKLKKCRTNLELCSWASVLIRIRIRIRRSVVKITSHQEVTSI